MRARHVLVLVATLLACRSPSRAPQATPPEQPRIAVLAFRVADDVAALAPEGFGASLARTLAERLEAEGLAVVEPERVFAVQPADRDYGPRLGARVAQKVRANLAVVGVVTRFRERVGTDWAAESPASVAYQATLVRAADGAVVSSDRFDYTQQPLTQNLLDLPRFLRGGGRWLTARELLDGALGETAGRFAVALGAGRRPTDAR